MFQRTCRNFRTAQHLIFNSIWFTKNEIQQTCALLMALDILFRGTRSICTRTLFLHWLCLAFFSANCLLSVFGKHCFMLPERYGFRVDHKCSTIFNIWQFFFCVRLKLVPDFFLLRIRLFIAQIEYVFFFSFMEHFSEEWMMITKRWFNMHFERCSTFDWTISKHNWYGFSWTFEITIHALIVLFRFVPFFFLFVVC